MTIHKAVKQVGNFVIKNSPAILTGSALLSLGGAVFFSGEARLKSDIIIHDLKCDQVALGKQYDDPIPKIEIVKKCFPVYVPTIIMTLIAGGCILGATHISTKRTALLASLYSASEMALKEYQSKVIEQIGEKKEIKVRDAVMQERLNNHPASKSPIIMTGKGESLCYDSWSGRYFYSDYEKVRAVANNVNRDAISDMWVALNEMYYYLGLTAIDGGADVGFDVDHLLEFRFSSHITDDGKPCLVLEYDHPRPRF